MSKPSFKELQYQFAGHIRNPEHNEIPQGIEDRRMAIYRELFFKNIEGFISNSFPVIRKITKQTRWLAMIRDFMANYRAHTPLFPELSREFLQYLNEIRDDDDDPEFLLELAHYEWVEVALAYSDTEIDELFINTSDLSQSILKLSPTAWLLQYHYPVHQITPDYLPQQAPDKPTLLLVNRNLNDQVKFSVLNPTTARLIEMVRDNESNIGQDILLKLASECGQEGSEAFIQHGQDILQRFHKLAAIYTIAN